jgi:hypothetical protein
MVAVRFFIREVGQRIFGMGRREWTSSYGSPPSPQRCSHPHTPQTSVLAAEPGLKITELISAITATSRAARYHPVTKAAIKMAVGRAVKRGTVVKIDAKYSLSEDAGRCHNSICCLIHLFLGGLLAGFGSIDPAFALVTFLLLLFSSLD